MRTTLRALGILLLLSACKPQEPATNTATTDTTTPPTQTATTDTTPPPPPHTTYRLDHYKFWKVKPAEINGTVFLKGQFDDGEWQAELRTIDSIANPTDKTDVAAKVEVKIQNEKLHYVAYSIRAKEQRPRNILVTNQFATDEPWKISQPKWLLVPALKRVIIKGSKEEALAEAAPKADHFVCYAADARKFPKVLLLADQFDRLQDPKHLEQIGELEIAYFCVPVQKRIDKRIEAINDPDTHLALYKINPPESYRVRVLTKDQFGTRPLDVSNSELLGVPSRKKWERPKS